MRLLKHLGSLVASLRGRRESPPELCVHCRRPTRPDERVNDVPKHHACLLAAAAVVDQALGAAVFDERAIPRLILALDHLRLIVGIGPDDLAGWTFKLVGLQSREDLERVFAEIVLEIEDRFGCSNALDRTRRDAARALAFLYNANDAPKGADASPVAHLN